MNASYLIFDLDDTLLTSDKKITKYTAHILKTCQERGHKLIINSARSFPFMKDYVKQINADYTIANGGAEIYKGEERIYFNGIDIQTVNSIIKELILNESSFSIQTPTNLYSSSIEYVNSNNLSRYFDFKKDFPFEASKIVFSCDNINFAKSLKEKYHLTLTNYLNGNWYRLSKTTKQTGNELLFKYLNISKPNVYAFGDDIGDLAMLKAYNGVAVKNSLQLILDEIKNITKFTNNEDGCAKYIEELMKEGKL